MFRGEVFLRPKKPSSLLAHSIGIWSVIYNIGLRNKLNTVLLNSNYKLIYNRALKCLFLITHQLLFQLVLYICSWSDMLRAMQHTHTHAHTLTCTSIPNTNRDWQAAFNSDIPRWNNTQSLVLISNVHLQLSKYATNNVWQTHTHIHTHTHTH